MASGRPSPSLGVVGHVEWVTHALGHVPQPGGIVDLSEPLEEPAGGGGVAAAAMARRAGSALLVTALGDDERAEESARILAGRGVEVVAASRSAPQTPVLSITHGDGERSIMVVGPRLQPRADDALPWHRMRDLAAVYYAGEDPGALQQARQARVLVVTARRIDDLCRSGVRPDVVVASGADADEDPWGLPGHIAPDVVVVTEGARGGVIHERGLPARRYAPARAPAPVVDSYGCGDTFAATLAVGLGDGLAIDVAVVAAAQSAAECATWRGGLGPPP